MNSSWLLFGITGLTALSPATASAAPLGTEAKLGLVAGPMLRDFVGVQAGLGLNGTAIPISFQAKALSTVIGRSVYVSAWGSSVTLSPQPDWAFGPMFGLGYSFSLPGASRAWGPPDIFAGIELTHAWGSAWLKLSPCLMYAPSSGALWPVVSGVIGPGPVLAEVGYQITPHLGLALRSSIYDPVALSFTF